MLPISTDMGMRPETTILLHCAFPRGELKTAEVRELIGEDFDWESIVESASHHGLLPHVWQACVKEFHDLVPSSIMVRLQRMGSAGSVRNHLWAGDLLHILHTLEASGITAVPFKGPVLAEHLYGEPWLRDVCDLDIIVRRKDVLAVKELLSRLGYVGFVDLPKSHVSAFVRTHTAFGFVHSQSTVLIDLHWGLSWRRRPTLFDTEAIWERLQTVTLMGRPVPGMCPEDLILALCLHHSKDMWSRLIMVSDVARCVALHPEIDWASVLSRADCTGTGIMLRMGLMLAGDLCGIELPDALYADTRNAQRVNRLVEEAKQRLIQGHAPYPDPLDRVRYFLKTMQKMSHKALFVLHVLAYPGLEDRVVMPPGGLQSITFRVRRVCRLLKTGLKALFRAPAPPRRR